MKFRYKAFLIHLLCSSLVACLSLFLVFVVWHPAPLAKAVGVGSIFLMLLGIDVILGPLLTLICANPKKPEIKRDLTIIVSVQIAALLYGMVHIVEGRPVYIAFDQQRFELITWSQLDPDSQAQAQAPYQHAPWWRPQWVNIPTATTPEDANERTFKELEFGLTPSMLPHLYEDFSKAWPAIIATCDMNLQQLKTYNPKEKVEQQLQKYPQADCFQPLKSYDFDMTILIDSKNKKVLDIVDLRPWA